MLILGTFLVDRLEEPLSWRLGVQLGSRGWFLDRWSDGTFRMSGYGPRDVAQVWPDEPEPPGDEPGGVREPRRPSPSAGGAAAAVADLD